MRVVVHSPEKTWELPWGVTCIGTDAACEIRVAEGPPVAGVLVRWLESVMVLGVGNPPALALDGAPLVQRKLDVRKIATSDLYGAWGATGVRLSVGQQHLTLAVEDVPSPARAAQFEAADLEAVMRAAIAHALRTGGDPARIGTADTLPELVARMAGCIAVRFDPPTQVDATTTQTMILRSHVGSWEARTMTLQWRDAVPKDFRPEQQAAGIAATLEDTLRALAEGRHAAGDPPAYAGGYTEMPQMITKLGAYGVLAPDDFDHLGLPRDRVRNPQLLISTIGGRTEMVDLSNEPELTIEGQRVRRARVDRDTPVRIFDTPISVTPEVTRAPEMDIPGRIFRHLALPADPVTQIARLGLLLPHLTSRTAQRQAYLVAGVSGVRGAGIFAGHVPRLGTRRFTPMFSRWLGETISGSPLPYCRIIDTALRWAMEHGGELVTPAPMTDPRLFEPDDAPPDNTAVYWGPLAVLVRDTGEALVCWKHVFDAQFHPAEISFLRALLAGLKTDGLLPPQDLTSADLPASRPAAPDGAALRVGLARLALADITVLGSAQGSDARIVLDPSMSSKHLLLVREASGHRIFDLRSRNGVFIDGRRVNEVKLEPGRDVAIASTTVRYEPRADEEMVPDVGAYLAEDVALEPDPARVREAERLLALGRDLERTPDAIMRARWLQVTGAALLDCHVHLLELAGQGLPVQLHGSTSPEPPAPALIEGARALISAAFQSGAPQGPDPEGRVAVPAVALPGGQHRPLAMLFHRADGWTDAQQREVWAYACLLGHASVAHAQLELGARRVTVDGPVWIGRAKDCQLVIDDAKLSRRHALVVPGRGKPPFLWAVDFNSDGGIRVGGEARDRFQLRDGDVLEVGRHRIVARVPPLPVLARVSERLAMLERAPGLLALGRQEALEPADHLTALVEHLRAALAVGRALVIGADGTVLAASTDPEIASSEPLERFARHSEIHQLLRSVRTAKAPFVRTLEVDRIYRKAAMASIQMVMPLTAKTALGVPFRDGRVLVLATLRTAPVAFTPAQLAVATAAVQRA